MTVTTPRRRWMLGLALAATLAATIGVSQDPGPDTAQDALADAMPAGPRLPSRRELAPDSDMQLGKRTERIATDPTQNAFANRNWTPPAPAAAEAPPQPPPTAPPLPFTFLGKLEEGDNAEVTIYLTQGEQVYSVRKGDVIEQTWRVESTSTEQIVLTYLPMATRQTLSFGNN